MSMNLKEEDRCVVNHGEDMMVIDFNDDVSLAEKLVLHEAGAAEWMVARIAGSQRATNDREEESAPTAQSWSGAFDKVGSTLLQLDGVVGFDVVVEELARLSYDHVRKLVRIDREEVRKLGRGRL
ncbi:hypothetical protein B296_00030863, partial [Ensete ventricosum]